MTTVDLDQIRSALADLSAPATLKPEHDSALRAAIVKGSRILSAVKVENAPAACLSLPALVAEVKLSTLDPEHIVDSLGVSIGRDLDDLLVHGDKASSDPFLSMMDGLVKQARHPNGAVRFELCDSIEPVPATESVGADEPTVLALDNPAAVVVTLGSISVGRDDATVTITLHLSLSVTSTAGVRMEYGQRVLQSIRALG